MPVTSWSTTPSLNVLDSGVAGSGGTITYDGTVMTPSQVDDALRSIYAQLATFFSDANFTLTSTDAGAAVGPTLTLYRNSASPAASDIIGQILFNGEDSAGNTQGYADIFATITDATSASEDANLTFRNVVAGTFTTQAIITSAGWTGMTIVQPTLTIKQGTAPTAEGDLQWNATTNAILVGDGAATQTFRPGCWEHIVTTDVAGAGGFSATGLSAYRKLRITGFIRPGNDGVNINVRTDANGGASYDAGASDYAWQYTLASASTTTSAEDTADNQIQLNGGFPVGNATEEGISFDLSIEEFNQARFMWLTGKITALRDTGSMYTGTISGKRLQATARDAIQIVASAGSFSVGHVTLEGIRG